MMSLLAYIITLLLLIDLVYLGFHHNDFKHFLARIISCIALIIVCLGLGVFFNALGV